MADDVFGIVGTTQAGNFHVEQVVAEGGFGVVYRALHGGFRAPVALKCLKVSEARTTRERDQFLEKFREEAELLFRLSASITEVVRPLHVDVLQLRDGQFVPFLALEWLEGESLDKVIDRRRMAGEPPMGLQKILKLFRPIAHAIARAHRFPSPTGTVSIIHRDLKPENIFITMQDGAERVRILDFGIAQARSLAEQAVGRVTGGDKLNAFSPAYAAPEQWAPKRFGQAGPWTDVWGLALTMVEALVGHQVIDGEPQAMMGTALDTSRRPTPRAEGVNLPVSVDAVFERALAVNPRDRTKDIETFWTELETSMGFAPSFGAVRANLDDPYGPVSAPLSTPPASAPPASVAPPSVRSIKARGGDVWIETPTESPSLELDIDLDTAPASLRSAVLGRRDGPASNRPDPADEVGAEIDLPSADAPPSSRVSRPPAPAAVPSAAAMNPRTRDLSTPPPMNLELAASPRVPMASTPGLDMARDAGIDVGRSSTPPPSVRPGPARAPLPSSAGRAPLPSTPAAARPLSAAPPAGGTPLPQRPQYRSPVAPIAPPPASLPTPAPTLLQRIGVAVFFLVLAVGILVTDLILRVSGPGLMFGSIRSFWFSALFFVVGAVLFFWRLLGDPSDG